MNIYLKDFELIIVIYLDILTLTIFFWNVIRCNLADRHQPFRGTCNLHLQRRFYQPTRYHIPDNHTCKFSTVRTIAHICSLLTKPSRAQIIQPWIIRYKMYWKGCNTGSSQRLIWGTSPVLAWKEYTNKTCQNSQSLNLETLKLEMWCKTIIPFTCQLIQYCSNRYVMSVLHIMRKKPAMINLLQLQEQLAAVRMAAE